MSYGKLIVRNGFFDFEYTPFEGTNINCSRRTRSAPARPTPPSSDDPRREKRVMQLDHSFCDTENLLQELRTINVHLGMRISNTIHVYSKCKELLDFMNLDPSKHCTRTAQSFLDSLAEAYQIRIEILLMKMLYNVLHMHHDRVTRFFSDLRSCKPFRDFHIQFFLDAHGQHGATHYLVFQQRQKPVRWYTIGCPCIDIDSTKAMRISQAGDTVCFNRTRRGSLKVVDISKTLHTARARWARIQVDNHDSAPIDETSGVNTTHRKYRI